MRIEIHSAWVCHAYAEQKQERIKSGRLRVTHALSGTLLADWSWSEDIDWPEDDDTFDQNDLLCTLGIPMRQRVLVDVIDAQSNVHVESGENLNNGFSRELMIAYRRCPRCAACQGVCMRKRARHSLCSHIGTSECRCAWHFSLGDLGENLGMVIGNVGAKIPRTELVRRELSRIDAETDGR